MKQAFGPWTGMRRACSPWFLRTRANPGASPQAGMKRAFGPWTGMRRAYSPWFLRTRANLGLRPRLA